MKLVVFQKAPLGLDITLEEMADKWREGVRGIPEITDFRLETADPDGWSGGEYARLIGDAEAALGVNLTKKLLTEEFFKEHPGLRYIATFAHGFEEIDPALPAKYDVTLSNTVYGDHTIAQYAIAMLLDICHKVSLHSEYTKHGYWEQKGEQSRSYARYAALFTRQIELCGKTFGVLGLGSIGLRAGKIADAMGMRVIGQSRHKKTGPQYDFVEQVSLEELLSRSDVLSLHCPLTEESRNIINRETIAGMKPGAILINTARGGLVDEAALYEALESRRLYAAALDVLVNEPPKERIPLMDSPWCTITSHIAWLSRDSRLRTVDIALENLKAYLGGHPVSVIGG